MAGTPTPDWGMVPEQPRPERHAGPMRPTPIMPNASRLSAGYIGQLNYASGQWEAVEGLGDEHG